jgi:hypothetical protein
MHMRSVPLFVLVALVGCQDKSGGGTSSGTSPSATPAQKQAAPSSSASSATPASAGSGALAADASGALALSWKAVNAQSPRVNVSVVAGEQTIPVGELDATADDTPSGTIEACSMKNRGKDSVFSCGGTPAYNFYTAKIDGGALVITLTTGVDQDPGSEKVKEILRRPTTATSLKATGPASQALYGNCRVGYVQRTADSPCLHKCIKGTECKGTDTCKLIDITGTDGPHKVSACVPAGK